MRVPSIELFLQQIIMMPLGTCCNSGCATCRLASRAQHGLTLSYLQVRQLAAVELRKRIYQEDGALWLQVEASSREQIKGKLPEMVLSESK